MKALNLPPKQAKAQQREARAKVHLPQAKEEIQEQRKEMRQPKLPKMKALNLPPKLAKAPQREAKAKVHPPPIKVVRVPRHLLMRVQREGKAQPKVQARGKAKGKERRTALRHFVVLAVLNLLFLFVQGKSCN